jgi:hypothetical protein
MAAVGVVVLIIAGLLKLTSQHTDLITWLIILGGILIGLDVALIWRRGGYYRRGTRPGL